MRASLVARCVRGLESAVAAEILTTGTGVVTALGHRQVHYRTDLRTPLPAGVPSPRTADDVFLLAARRADVGATRDGLPALAELAELADPARLSRLRDAWFRDPGGSGGTPVGVEVSASFLHRRTFNRYDAEDVVGRVLARRLGLPYHSRRTGAAPPPGCLGWRLTLDGTAATLLLRTDERPLHRREYKLRTLPGTLHPPVAAAMAAMADVRTGHTVLDPCCGAGTLLIEAALARPDARYRGFDLSRDALAAARTNAAARTRTGAGGRGAPRADAPGAAPGDALAFDRADAGRLPLPDGSVDRVLCNPPWNGQVAARGLLAAAPERWWAELRRVLAPDGAAVLLLPDTDALTAGLRHGLAPLHVQRVRLAGARPLLAHLAPPAPTRRDRRA
ncbi:TRM11 family SAM-dependent methyltransferase [Streptomyces sp. NPDC054784]